MTYLAGTNGLETTDHDWLAVMLATLATIVSQADVMFVLQSLMLVLTSVFLFLGICLRWKRMNGYRPPKEPGDDAN